MNRRLDVGRGRGGILSAGGGGGVKGPAGPGQGWLGHGLEGKSLCGKGAGPQNFRTAQAT